jgi:hypothetical protein
MENRAVLALFAMGAFLAPNLSMAAYWTDYSLKLKKVAAQLDPAINLYQISLETPGGQPVTPVGRLKESLDQITRLFAVGQVRLGVQPYTMRVEARDNNELALTFAIDISKEQSHASCFQVWYETLSNPDKYLLQANLVEPNATVAATELAKSADSFKSLLSTSFESCSSHYDSWVLRDQYADYLYIGFTRWFAQLPLEAGYTNFKFLLDPSRSVVDGEYGHIPETAVRELLRRFIETVSLRATPDSVFSGLPRILGGNTGNSPSRLALAIVKEFSTVDELRTWAGGGVLSELLKLTLSLSDELLRSCFYERATGFEFHCGTESQAAGSLARLVYQSTFGVAPFSFLAFRN